MKKLLLILTFNFFIILPGINQDVFIEDTSIFPDKTSQTLQAPVLQPTSSEENEVTQQDIKKLLKEIIISDNPDIPEEELNQKVQEAWQSWESLTKGIMLTEIYADWVSPDKADIPDLPHGSVWEFKYNLRPRSVTSKTLFIDITQEEKDFTKYDKLRFYVKGDTNKFRLGFVYLDENGKEKLVMEKFQDIADVEIKRDRWNLVEVDLEAFKKKHSGVEWNNIKRFEIETNQRDLSRGERIGELFFKDICFTLDETKFTKEELQNKLFSLEEIKYALTLKQDWDLGDKEDWKQLRELQKRYRDSERDKFNVIDSFYNIDSPEDAYNFTKNYFPKIKEHALLSAPNTLFNLVFSKEFDFPSKNVASIDYAFWQALGLKRAGYKTYLLAVEENDDLINPKWEYYVIGKKDSELYLINREGVKGISNLEDLSENKNHYLIEFNSPPDIVEALGYYKDIRQEIREDFLSELISKRYKFEDEDFREQFITRVIKENINYLIEAKDEKTSFIHDHILLGQDNKIKGVGEYTQPPIIGLELLFLTAIAKQDIEVEDIAPEEATEEVDKILTNLNNLPTWNGLYFWYSLTDEVPEITYSSIVNSYENGYLTAALGMVQAAFKNNQSISSKAEKILEEQREGWQKMGLKGAIIVDWRKVTCRVLDSLKDRGIWDRLVVETGIKKGGKNLGDIIKVMMTDIDDKEIKKIIEEMQQNDWFRVLKKEVVEQMQEISNVYKASAIDNLYTDGRIPALMQAVLGTIEPEKINNIDSFKKVYTLNNGKKIEVVVPYEGAFQAWAGLLFFPEMEVSDSLKEAHQRYAAVQLDYSNKIEFPGGFSAVSNPYPEENQGGYEYASRVGVPGASQYPVREGKPILTPHAIGLLSLVDRIEALKILAEFEVSLPQIKGKLGWRDSVGINGEVSNTYLGVDQLFLLTSLIAPKLYKYMKAYLQSLDKLERINNIYQNIDFGFN